MRKIIFIFTAVCLLLGGCSVIKDTNETDGSVPVSTLASFDSDEAFRVQKSAVYFYNETSDTLTAEIRSLIIGQDANPASTAIELLLAGPLENSQLSGVAQDEMKLSFIEYSGNVANVYLRTNGEELAPRQKYILELAIANTVTDLLDASYVCIFYNGVYTGFSGKTRAPLQKQTGYIEEAYNQALAKYIGTLEPEQSPGAEPDEPSQTPQTNADGTTVTKETDIATVLYFVSQDGGYILPEVRSITYKDGDYVEKLFKELLAGPKDTANMKSLLPNALELTETPIINEDRLTLCFNKLPAAQDLLGEDYQASFAALVYTITGFLPGIKNIDIKVLDQPITAYDSSFKLSDGMQRSDYYGLIGRSAPVYFNDKNSDLLLKVQRTMEQSSTWSARQRIDEVLRGPVYSDTASAWPVIPSGINNSDILSVKMYEDTVYVDLSQNFKDACIGLSSKNEMLLVFSIVNTLTEMDGINKVQFLIEGKQSLELAGTLCISDPFLMNYDIIK